MATRCETLIDLAEHAYAEHAERPALGTRGEGGWSWMTYGEIGRRVDQARGGLAGLGVEPGDRVAIISRNRLEWALTCHATLGLGAALVPMYEAQRPADWRFMLEDSGAKVAVVSRPAIRSQILAMQRELPALAHVIGIEQGDEEPGSFAGLLRRGASSPQPTRSVTADAEAQIIYTSGTTGKPKGVVLTHANILADVRAMQQLFPIGPEERTVSFLPWAHVLGQIAELHNGLSSGASMALNGDLKRLVEDIQEIQPTLLVAVPSVFNRIYQSVLAQVADKPKLVRKLFDDGIAAATRRSHGERIGFWPRLELAVDDRLIFAKVRERLGGRLKWVFSGGAALGREVAELIDAVGITVHEGYGLTETSCTVSMQPQGERKVGTVGRPLPGVTVEIDRSVGDDPSSGEIIVYGPIVMRGDLNRPDEDARSFTATGGLRTGDLGHFDDDGYLVITGRIKEQYKLQNGKYVMPVPLEEHLKLSPYIKNVMVYGADRPYNVALVVPDPDSLQRWAGKPVMAPGDPASARAVRELLAAEIEELGRGFRSFEVPRRFAVLSDDFTTDNGLLTPTLKLKRAAAAARYADEIESLYAGDANEVVGAAALA